ncbi:uncharacterized protein LOC111829395 [Capsella rubella]|uniref:uncharacterized protein LOC111829395 n=1 Tax=Capsella rubella TaxID=81985 RepID=UPI000CD4BA57|nr:uncharacterized protein LOC111829395 [Capsella rubella]
MNFIMCKNPEANENVEVFADTTRKISAMWRLWLKNSVGLMRPLLKHNFHGSAVFVLLVKYLLDR